MQEKDVAGAGRPEAEGKRKKEKVDKGVGNASRHLHIYPFTHLPI